MIHMFYFERERNWWRLPQIFSKNSELQRYDLVKKPTRSDFSTTQPQLEYIDYVPTPIDGYDSLLHADKVRTARAGSIC